ncbi:flagellar protein FlgN [Nocardioides ferulae]|uniref:flagellar protein FlgN n=1 Tax=Nocardioides ferulae TaxID=2340821 RepID=UPI000EB241DE|nr:flagellar protein FlgN [Nocardioides ferulae]
MSEHVIERLSLVLWRERELLESLRYKLEVEQLVMAGGRSQWLGRAATEVEQVLQVIRETEALRATAADEVAVAIGLPANPSLTMLVDSVDEPWHTMLRDHRDAFAAITDDIVRLADANRGLIAAGFRSARETLLSIDAGLSTYTPSGSAVTERVAAARLDRSL